ncbi:MAG: hypothetical protein AUH30_03975 [Candidatus Rokubacteria bacterium 13_1_40CM_68_15]|nr:MAG: hypothetical protein AUH30_03975 [Candidatus Rokubacteria bacterium 13_1_40CM_68_15]
MSCRELIAVLDDYLEGALTPESHEELEAHLRACPPCCAYLATYRKTRSIAAAAHRLDMPEEMKERLRQFVAKRTTPRR